MSSAQPILMQSGHDDGRTRGKDLGGGERGAIVMARNTGSDAAGRRDDVIPARSNVNVTGSIATQAEQSEGWTCFFDLS